MDNYERCLVDPTKRENILELRNKYPEFKYETIDIDTKIITYIVLMYDINSPIKKLGVNLSERKVMAAQKSGFRLNENNRFDEVVEKMLIGKTSKVNAMICRYIIMHGLPDLIAYTAYNEILNTELERSLEKSKHTTQDIKVIRDNVFKTTSDLNDLYIKIFGEDESQHLKNKLYETLENDSMKLRPEHIALSLQDGTYDPIINPYDVNIERI